jgi:16S rRNA (guanine527-N7)-methyltransferase
LPKKKSSSGCCRGLELKNVKAEQMRAESEGDFDFIVSRAVTNMPDCFLGETKIKRTTNTN